MHKSVVTLALASSFALGVTVSPTKAGFGLFASAHGSGTFCTHDQPCSFTTALDLVDSAGQVTCVDTFGIQFLSPITLQKSVTIDCPNSLLGNSLPINAPGHVIVLRNLTFNTFGFSGPPSIDFTNGRALVIENCTFINHYGKTPPIAVNFRPQSGGSQLTVKNSSFVNNGIGSVGGGIVVRPEGSGNAKVLVEGVTIGHGIFGIAADGTGSTAGINMTISNSQITSNSQDGIIAVTSAGGAPIGVLVTNTRSINNNIGIRSVGPNVTVRVESSKITGNGTGLAFGSGGALLTAGNNLVAANGTNGAFSGSVGLQ